MVTNQLQCFKKHQVFLVFLKHFCWSKKKEPRLVRNKTGFDAIGKQGLLRLLDFGHIFGQFFSVKGFRHFGSHRFLDGVQIFDVDVVDVGQGDIRRYFVVFVVDGEIGGK